MSAFFPLPTGPPALSLSVEPLEKESMIKPPRNPREQILTKGMLGYIITTGFVMAAGTLGIFTYMLRVNPQAAQTLAFTTFVFFQLFNVLNCRSNSRSVFKIGLLSNRTSIISITGAILVQAAIVYLPQVQGVFGTVPLSSWDWLLSIATASIIFFAFEIYKATRINHQSFPPE